MALSGATALIADDHELFRDGLALLLADLLNAETVVEAASLDEAMEKLRDLPKVDLIIVDLRMPGMSGPESLAALLDGFPESRVVVISAWEERAEILAALEVGAHGYIPKSLSNTQMVDALRLVMNGGVFAPPSLGRRDSGGGRDVAASPAPASGGEPLRFTQRQRDVLDELRKGRSSKEIARTLDIAEGTVKIHLAAIYRALGVRTRAEAIVRLAGGSLGGL